MMFILLPQLKAERIGNAWGAEFVDNNEPLAFGLGALLFSLLYSGEGFTDLLLQDCGVDAGLNTAELVQAVALGAAELAALEAHSSH
jgi:hypothetical protein